MSVLYFRLATVVLVFVVSMRKCDGSTLPAKFPTCQFSHATYDMYVDLVARGTGSVTLHNVTCICYIGTAQISVISQDDAGINYTISSVDCEGVLDCADVLGPSNDCRDINPNILSKINLTGTFNQNAVIQCWTVADPNKASPLVVWVDNEPVDNTATSSESSTLTVTETAPAISCSDAPIPTVMETAPISTEKPSISCSSLSTSVCILSTTTSFLTTTLTLSTPDLPIPTVIRDPVPLVAGSSSVITILAVIIVVLIMVLIGLCYQQHRLTRVHTLHSKPKVKKIVVQPKEK